MGRRRGGGRSSKKGKNNRNEQRESRNESQAGSSQSRVSEETTPPQRRMTAPSGEDVLARGLRAALQLGSQPSAPRSSAARRQERSSDDQTSRSTAGTERTASQRDTASQVSGGQQRSMEAIDILNHVQRQECSILHEALGTGNLLLAMELLKYGADPNLASSDGMKSMHCIAYGFYDAELEYRTAIRLLVDHKVSVDQQDGNGRTALHLAAGIGNTVLLKTLLSFKADVSLRSTEGLDPLMIASLKNNLECMRLLVEKGKADVCGRVASGATAIYMAAEHGYEDIVSYLLSKGAPIDSACIDGITSLMAALARGHNKCAIVLIEGGADVKAVAECGRTPLLFAAAKGSPKVIQMLLRRGADVNQETHETQLSPLCMACETVRSDQKKIAELLLSYSPDLDCATIKGGTPLLTCIFKHNEALVKLLLDAGASPSSSRTPTVDVPLPLHLAVASGLHRIAELLISHGADVNDVGALGETPLFHAAHKGDIQMIQLLAQHGANLNAVGHEGSTAVSFAIAEDNLESARTLAELGADVNIEQPSGETAFCLALRSQDTETIQTFIRCGADVNRHVRNDPLINVAVVFGLQYTELLIEAGADVNNVDGKGIGPLYLASVQGLLKIAQALLRAGADPNIRGERGATPLHAAAEQGYVETARLLLENGADPFLTFAGSETPCDLARFNGQAEVAKLLTVAMKTGKVPKQPSPRVPKKPVVNEASEKPHAESSTGTLEKATPTDALCCPITLSLMEDPVVAADGHSYERAAITRWIRSHGTSPVTKQPLCLKALVPNLNLKYQIETYKTENGI